MEIGMGTGDKDEKPENGMRSPGEGSVSGIDISGSDIHRKIAEESKKTDRPVENDTFNYPRN